MRLNDPTTWLQADTEIEIDEHPDLGKVRVRQWIDLHFYRAPGQKVNLILVERMKPMSNGQPFPPLWLAWVGERTLPKRNCLVQIFTTLWSRSLVSICEAKIALDIA
ncbi:hypothetical protein [Microcoleus sp. PH2017_18_LLB_O_A]|nr:hypothetical protein [Microcoleus sp. PH2017_18_LLB_O_A]